MRQFRRPAPTPSILNILRALAATLVVSAVVSAPVPMSAAQAQTAPVEPTRQRQAAAAQGAPAGQTPVTPGPAVVYQTDRRNAEETRERLRQVIEQYSPSLFEVFRHDPTLLRNDQYLTSYPGLAAFLQQHPEIGHNPSYFVGQPHWERNRDPRTAGIDVWRNMMEGLTIFAGFSLAASVFIWLIKTLIDYRRWLRLTRIQTEAHTQLLDRLTSNDDLMAYIQSPSGRRFLESAPIALDASNQRAVSAPVSRILLSIQAGAVLACGGVGFLYASGRVIEEIAPGLFTIGVLAIAFGVGFFVSAILAYGLSERLGLLSTPASRPTTE
jgi:hypothetical protein